MECKCFGDVGDDAGVLPGHVNCHIDSQAFELLTRGSKVGTYLGRADVKQCGQLGAPPDTPNQLHMGWKPILLQLVALQQLFDYCKVRCYAHPSRNKHQVLVPAETALIHIRNSKP